MYCPGNDVTGFSDVIMERVVHSIHVVLGDWSGYTSMFLDNRSLASLHFTERFLTMGKESHGGAVVQWHG